MSTRADVLIAVDDLPAALAAGAQLLDVRWRLGEKPGSGFDRYLQGHLPDARFLDLEAVLTGPTTDPTLGRHPLPDVDQLGAGLGALGIDPALPIVVYDEPGSFAAGRAWWVLRWAGLDVRVLDGGITRLGGCRAACWRPRSRRRPSGCPSRSPPATCPRWTQTTWRPSTAPSSTSALPSATAARSSRSTPGPATSPAR